MILYITLTKLHLIRPASDVTEFSFVKHGGIQKTVFWFFSYCPLFFQTFCFYPFFICLERYSIFNPKALSSSLSGEIGGKYVLQMEYIIADIGTWCVGKTWFKYVHLLILAFADSTTHQTFETNLL